jgi:acyl-CoA synthetase (NDP forming)
MQTAAPVSRALAADEERRGLAALFAPRAIAVLGASGREDNPFARPLGYLLERGYPGPVYPVNPGYDVLRGVPCYPSLADLPGPVDLVLMLVSAAEAVRQLPAVAAAGATAAVVFASGFAEIGPAGQRLQDELVAVARAHGVRLLGPNCQGIVSVHDRMAATFTAALEHSDPRPGNLAYVGQSGAVGGSVLSLAGERGLGIAAWASTGNQADLTALDIGRHLLDDDRVRVLALYLESTVDGQDFTELARRAHERGTSVLVLQSALSQAGARAAVSHTGALLGSNAAFLATCEAYGVVVADDVEDFIATAQALSVLPRAAGRRVAIVTTSGGAGSLAADQAEAGGLVVEDLDDATQATLAALVPDFGAVANPVDVTAQLFKSGSADDFVRVCDAVLADDGVDAVLVALTMVTGAMAATLAQDLAGLWARTSKPIVVVWLAARDQTAEARALLREAGWPVLDSPRTAVRVLRALATPPVVPGPLSRALPPGARAVLTELAGPVLTEGQAGPLLQALGIAQPEQYLVSSAAEAARAAKELGGPLVVKVQSPQVLHKTELGGIRLGVAVEDAAQVHDELVAAFAGIGPVKVLLQKMAGPGPELIVGLTNTEPGFPPLLTVGLGGVATELYRDTVSRLAPVDEEQADAMIRALRAAPLLTGFRGQPGVDLTAATRAIARLSQLASALGDRLVELEVNPLRLTGGGEGALALDFLLRLADTGSGPPAQAPAPQKNRTSS